jgi:hypothetical protein
MAWRSLLLLAVCCSLSRPADAGDQPRPEVKHRLSCVLVRYYVAKYTAAAAEAYARSKGASEAEMEAARRCLPPTITAQGAS